MQQSNAIFLIKPYYCANIKGKEPSLKIYFELGKWKKEFSGEYSSFESAIKEIKRLGFQSYKEKERGKWVRKFISPLLNGTSKDWKRIYNKY